MLFFFLFLKLLWLARCHVRANHRRLSHSGDEMMGVQLQTSSIIPDLLEPAEIWRFQRCQPWTTLNHDYSEEWLLYSDEMFTSASDEWWMSDDHITHFYRNSLKLPLLLIWTLLFPLDWMISEDTRRLWIMFRVMVSNVDSCSLVMLKYLYYHVYEYMLFIECGLWHIFEVHTDT